MKIKPICIIVLIVLIIIVIVVFFNHTRGGSRNMMRVSNTEIAFSNMILTDTNLTATAIFTSSGKSFRGYDYTIEENTLYITVYGGLVSNKYPNGDLTIDIQDELQSITTICLKNNDDVTVLYTR